jgi:hypothetical protein
VLDAVTAAETEHAKLRPDRWGVPGGSLGTFHPAGLKSYVAAVLIDVGRHGEAIPRLDEARRLPEGPLHQPGRRRTAAGPRCCQPGLPVKIAARVRKWL